MNSEALVREINKNMAIELPEEIALEELQRRLGIYLNELIQNDFQKLIMLLYRIDVSEPRLKQLLQVQPQENAGNIIADLIIERQLQKIKSRQQFRQQNNDFDGEEKW